MNEPEPRLTTGLQLVRWIGWAQRKAGEDWIRARELSFEQGFALGYLVQNPGAIQRDLARLTRTSAASVSSLLQGLERRGLVEHVDAHTEDVKLGGGRGGSFRRRQPCPPIAVAARKEVTMRARSSRRT